MKFIVLSLSLILSAVALSHDDIGPDKHLPLELTLKESQNLYRQFLSDNINKNAINDLQPETQAAINGGEKFSTWLKKINESRTAENQIRLTSKKTRKGIPIDKPSKYGPKTIKERFNKLNEELSETMLKVAYGNDPITTPVPEDIEKFIEEGRKVNRLYQTAVRWSTSVKPWLPWYKQRKQKDVRGFYFLKRMDNLDEILKDFRNLETEKKKDIKSYLLGLCLNSRASVKNCKKRLDAQIKKQTLVAFKNTFWKFGQKTWDSFFKITNPRTDVRWGAKSPDTMNITFVDPKNDKIRDWLQVNIEDEFKWQNWNLRMNFVERSFGTAYLQFKPNVTPHVTQGNIIVMDQNTPIEEYEVRWTIRHEYGHILRIPDCYVEFYDEDEELVINYQLDVKDLMCSRAGDMNERIYKELKRNYFK